MNSGLVILDLDSSCNTLSKVCEVVGEKLVTGGYASYEVVQKLKKLWLMKHRHQFEGTRKAEGNISAVIRDLLVQKLENKVK